MKEKSIWDIHLQITRITNETRRMQILRPQNAFLIERRVHDIICKYIDVMKANGIDTLKDRHRKLPRKMYAGY